MCLSNCMLPAEADSAGNNDIARFKLGSCYSMLNNVGSSFLRSWFVFLQAFIIVFHPGLVNNIRNLEVCCTVYKPVCSEISVWPLRLCPNAHCNNPGELLNRTFK